MVEYEMVKPNVKRLSAFALALLVTAALVSLWFCDEALAFSQGLKWSRAGGDTALDTMELVVLDSEFGFMSHRYDLIAVGSSPEKLSSGDYETLHGTDSVVVVTNASWHDAAAAQALAGKDDAAVLITDPNNLSEQTRRVVEKLHPKHVTVVGGPLALSDGVIESLAEVSGVEVERVWGENAAGTALACYNARDGWGQIAFLATSATWQDAVSAGPYSYMGKCPMFLAGQDGVISQDVYERLAGSSVRKVVIMGGAAAIPESESARLEAAGLQVDRIAGANAVETCALTIRWIRDGGILGLEGVNSVIAATSIDYHDASIAASCCGRNKMYLALVSSSGNQVAIEEGLPRNYASGSSSQDFYTDGTIQFSALALGGTAAIPQDVYEAFPVSHLP